jgi:hypothetical protein
MNTLASFKVRNMDAFNEYELRAVSAVNVGGQERRCGPALYVLSRTYAELGSLVGGLVAAYRRANPVFIHNMATDDMNFLRTFWSPTPRVVDDGSAPDCNGNPLGRSFRYAAGTDPRRGQTPRNRRSVHSGVCSVATIPKTWEGAGNWLEAGPTLALPCPAIRCEGPASQGTILSAARCLVITLDASATRTAPPPISLHAMKL